RTIKMAGRISGLLTRRGVSDSACHAHFTFWSGDRLMPWWTGASGLRLQLLDSATQLSEGAEEGPLPGVPTQDAINQAAATLNNLTGAAQECVDERLELHAQHRLLFLLMPLDVPTRPRR